MKKSILLLVLLGFFLTEGAQAHNWGVSRDWCPPIWRRFAAHAQIQLAHIRKGGRYDLLGRWIPYDIWIWNETCHDVDKGCTRPRSAYCEQYFYLYDYGFWQWYGANAGWAINFSGPYSGYQWAHWSNHPRIQPGVGGPKYIDHKKYEALDKKGNSYGLITGNLELSTKDKTLTIENLSGTLSIAPGSNYYSTYKILVIKERTDMTEDEEKEGEEMGNRLEFRNIVASGELTVTKDGPVVSGFLKEMDLITRDSTIDEDTTYGFRFSNVNAVVPVETDLEEGEVLSLVVYSDGGFNFDLAKYDGYIYPDDPKYPDDEEFTKTMIAGTEEQVSIWPNPVTERMQLRISSAAKAAHADIALYDLAGRKIKDIYSGSLNEGENQFSTDLSALAKGIYTVKIVADQRISYHKVLVE